MNRGRENELKILTAAQVRDDDGLGSGSNAGKRVGNSKNESKEHFQGKRFCDYT